MQLPRLAAVFLAAMLSAPAAEKPVHLFILSGQSNMAGMKPEAGFLPEAKTLFADAEVAFIKVAKGGMPIRDWVAEWDEIAGKHGIDPAAARGKSKQTGQPFYQQILAQMKPLMEKHPDPASITFCWMQGENDARHKLDAAYADSLKQLVSNLRRDLKRPDMKADDAAWQAVRKAQVTVAETDSHGAWVDCDDLNDKTRDGKTVNDLHYTPEGYKLLGQRYARQAKALVDGKPVAKDGRP
jgi:lysophospholipase L1-like esterase